MAETNVTARTNTEAALARIAAIEPKINAFTQVTEELALNIADSVDERVARGEDVPLAGMTVGLKDNLNLVGTRTTCASRILENYESIYTATAVERLIEAGAVPVGKCNMDEFAFGSSTETSVYGPTHNPWDTERVPGGSSGGSAAAVAAGMVDAALGSDTGGSIRQPGAFTGTVALKPTYGRVSRYGCAAFASSLDQVGPLARTVEDTARVLNAIAGHDARDATSVPREAEDFTAELGRGAEGLRVAVAVDWLAAEGLDPEVKAGVLAAAEALASAGAEVGEVTLPNIWNGHSAYYIIAPAEASSNLARLDGVRYGVRATNPEDVLDLYVRSRSEGFGPETIRRIVLGTYVLSAGHYDSYYGQAQKARTIVADDFAQVFAGYDIILTPTAPTPAFKLDEKIDDVIAMCSNDIFTVPVNLAGNTALSLPMGLSTGGLPMGLQLIANHFDERTLLRTAAVLEDHYGFVCTPAHASAHASAHPVTEGAPAC